jgi:hypothetical protein
MNLEAELAILLVGSVAIVLFASWLHELAMDWWRTTPRGAAVFVMLYEVRRQLQVSQLQYDLRTQAAQFQRELDDECDDYDDFDWWETEE